MRDTRGAAISGTDMPNTCNQEPRTVHAKRDESVQTQQGELRPDRITLITRRIATKRAGARLKVRKSDVRMALAGVDTLHTRCMAPSLREIDEGELRAWIAQGWITGDELQNCQGLNPRKR